MNNIKNILIILICILSSKFSYSDEFKGLFGFEIGKKYNTDTIFSECHSDVDLYFIVCEISKPPIPNEDFKNYSLTLDLEMNIYSIKAYLKSKSTQKISQISKFIRDKYEDNHIIFNINKIKRDEMIESFSLSKTKSSKKSKYDFMFFSLDSGNYLQVWDQEGFRKALELKIEIDKNIDSSGL